MKKGERERERKAFGENEKLNADDDDAAAAGGSAGGRYR